MLAFIIMMEWTLIGKLNWLQLAFPIYIILLVVIIIIVASDHSMKFSELIAKKNPVATLILLSYTKLLCIVISSMTVLWYIDLSR